MIRILIADDHDIVRTGLRHILELSNDFEVVGEAGTGREALRLCRSLNPDVLLLDLDMPEMDGLDVIVNLKAAMPRIKIIVLTMHDKEDYAARAIKGGAAGFLLKGSSPGDLPAAVRAVARGGVFLVPGIAEKLALRYCSDSDAAPLEKLSMREIQIISRLARDMKLREIAEEMNISISTVATYKQRITDKLGLKRRGDFAKFAKENNLIV